MLKKLQKIAAAVRDVGLIIGIPIVASISYGLYGEYQKGMEAQITALKEQNEVLRTMQYDRAIVMLESQKKATEVELDNIENSIRLVGKNKINIRKFNSQLLCLDMKK